MRKTCAVLLAIVSMPAFATTYTVTPGSSAATIQATLNIAGAGPGNVVLFSAGSYTLSSTLTLPCNNGTLYTGPNVGVVTQSNLPTAIMTASTSLQDVFDTPPASSTNTGYIAGVAGCAITYFQFNGTGGGIWLHYPSYGVTIDSNAFTHNNPTVPVSQSLDESNIWVGGYSTPPFDAAHGANYITISNNVSFGNCAAIQADESPKDDGGYCNLTMISGYNNYVTIQNNTISGTEQGIKFVQRPSASAPFSLNLLINNNNVSGYSRIGLESQQITNGNAVVKDNAFYQPTLPGNQTFNISLPAPSGCTSPCWTVLDNANVNGVPVWENGTPTASNAYYGINTEIWGAGAIVEYNIMQGGNQTTLTCQGGTNKACSNNVTSIGGAYTNATMINNTFSGFDTWNGIVNSTTKAITFEDGASAGNAGLTMAPNTVLLTSAIIPTVAPTISQASSTGSAPPTITLADSDTNHALTIFYTTDGSTPCIFARGSSCGTTQIYGAPFPAPSSNLTIKAIAHWGQGANQGIVFPQFGYVPSPVVSATVASARTLVGAYIVPRLYSSVAPGSTVQFIAYGNYSDGSVATLPDADGNAVTLWNTSNHKVAKISTQGHATAYTAGSVTVTASVGSLQATPWPLTIVGTPVAADAAKPKVAARVAAAGQVPAAPGTPRRDDFTGPFWRPVAPAGGSASISGQHLFLGVPGGANHEALPAANQAVRVVQTIGNQDFDVAIRIDSPMVASDGITSQGLMVGSDNQGYLTFGLTSDGARIGLQAQTVTQGVATHVLNDPDFSQYQNPMYLRLIRNSHTYVALYSIDGASWSQAATFAYAQPDDWIGPFAGNYSDTPANAPPVVMSVNWFDVQP